MRFHKNGCLFDCLAPPLGAVEVKPSFTLQHASSHALVLDVFIPCMLHISGSPDIRILNMQSVEPKYRHCCHHLVWEAGSTSLRKMLFQVILAQMISASHLHCSGPTFILIFCSEVQLPSQGIPWTASLAKTVMTKFNERSCLKK